MDSVKSFLNPKYLLENKEMLVILGVVAVIVMMLLPVPAMLLDVLLALMISISLLVLLISMYLKNVLDFSIFPGLLLIVTLFRIALNISTTRLILSEGQAGSVIHAFAEFVTSGSLVIGVVIFAIIMIVQFMVVTKGSGRIAEVAARFTLDAMPGKQMAVDADLNAGIISEEEAKKRRKDISREADFYGAMDGASKFVSGDAKAGLIITAINIVGGFVSGMWFQDMTFMDSLTNYTKLTIGDGLVTQLPALMISVASGIMVTRAVGTGGDLGTEMLEQFSQSVRAMFVASGIMLFLGTVGGLPPLPFITLGVILGLLGWRLYRGQNPSVVGLGDVDLNQDGENLTPAEEVKPEEFLKIDQMEMEIGYSLISLVDKNQGGDLLDRISMMRKQMATDLGILVPPIRIRDNIQLQPTDYIVKIKGIEVGRGVLMAGCYLAMNPGGAVERIRGIETVEPAFGLPALWITESQKEQAELAGYTVVELAAVLATHLTELIRHNASSLLSRQDVKTLVENLRSYNASVVEDLLPSVISYGELHNVLSNLLKEGVTIRDLGSILESLADSARVSREITYLTDQVRISLSRHICDALKDERGELGVLVLHPQLESVLEASVQKTDRGPRLVVRPEMVGKLYDALSKEVDQVMALNAPPVLVCSPSLRFPLRKLLESSFAQLTLLSYAEISSGIQVHSLGTVNLADN